MAKRKSDLQVQQRPVDKLVPYAKNSRTHDRDQIAKIAASIKEFGFTSPVLIGPKGDIVAGHARVLAAKKLGLKAVPTIALAHLTAAQRRAYVIADNRLAELAGWDDKLLAAELGDLQKLNFDLGLIGFDDADIRGILGSPTGADPDDAPALPTKPVTRLGDIWACGEHRVLCGDATAKGDVEKVLGAALPHLMVTDPPYGVDYDPDWRNRADRANGKPYGARAIGSVRNDDRSDWSPAFNLFPGAVVYCWHAGRHASTVQAALEAANFEVRYQIIWAKTRMIISRGDYHWQHEPCWYAVRKGETSHWSGSRSQTTLWDIDHVKSETGHSTQKPVDCMKRPIENNSKRGDAVYDPFIGSGTTMIAAQMTARACFGMDIDPSYVDVAVRRWQDYTGHAAMLAGTKKTFDQISRERLKRTT